MAVLDTALQRCPTCRHALASRAHLRATAGQHAAAQADLATLLQHHPDDAAAWFNLGFLREADGHLESALQAFQRATALSPRLDRGWYGQALVLIRLQRLDEAVLALERSTALQPMSPFAWYQLARVQAQRQQRDEAARIIGHLQGFEPRFAAQLQRETGLCPRVAAPSVTAVQ
jgi:predicted Zn-dependent protease